MKLNEIYPRRYANGEDLQGRPVKVIISRVALETMRPSPQSAEVTRPVLYVQGGQRSIVMSRTLATEISRILQAEDTEAWSGKQVTLYPVPLNVAGQPRVAIRAKSA